MSYHNRRVDRIMFRNPVSPDWYNPVQPWMCPGCKRECGYKHCPRCPFIQCPLHKDFQLRETPIPANRYNMQPCSYCGMHGCQCGALNMFSSQLLEMRNRKMRERREAMTQFFVFLMIVFFVVIFVTCMLQTK